MQRVFEICFAAVVMVFGGVSLLTNQKLYRFLVKPRFELGVFPADQSRLLVCGALPETAECLDDFETNDNEVMEYVRHVDFRIPQWHQDSVIAFLRILKNSSRNIFILNMSLRIP